MLRVLENRDTLDIASLNAALAVKAHAVEVAIKPAEVVRKNCKELPQRMVLIYARK